MVAGDEGERVLRSEHRIPLLAAAVDVALPTRKRKPLTPQQLEERKKNVSETKKSVEVIDCMFLIYLWLSLLLVFEF